jgi:hypothetical protein
MDIIFIIYYPLSNDDFVKSQQTDGCAKSSRWKAHKNWERGQKKPRNKVRAYTLHPTPYTLS